MKPLYSILVLLFLSACSKNETGNNDKTPPTITVSSPANNQVFGAGQTVPITMEIKDDQKLFVVHVHISDNSTGQLLYDIHRYPDNSNYSLDESFIAKAGTAYKILVIARDTGGNESNLNLFVSAN